MSHHLTCLNNCAIFYYHINRYPLIQFAKGCSSNCQSSNYSCLAGDNSSPCYLLHWNGTYCSNISICSIFCKGIPDEIERKIRHKKSPPSPPQGEQKTPWQGRHKRSPHSSTPPPPLRESGKMYSLVE